MVFGQRKALKVEEVEEEELVMVVALVSTLILDAQVLMVGLM